jgi:acetyltransferase-like isoleucine patch superfamily enzyme
MIKFWLFILVFFLKIINQLKKFSFLIRNLHSKIKFDLKLFNDGRISLGKNISIDRGCIIRVQKKSTFFVCDNVFIGKDSEINSNKHILIGEKTTIQSRANIFGDVKILSNCVIGPNLYVSSFSHKFAKDSSELIINQDKTPSISKQVVINEDCFIGINVFIKPGINIGRGCVIGANTNVITNLDPYSIVAGNPAKLLKKRFEFFPKDEINSENTYHFPYFYKGFKKDSNSGKLYVNEIFFCIALNLHQKTEATLEITSNISCTLTLLNENSKKKIEPGNSIINFRIKKQTNNFLEFELKASTKNILFEIKSVKSI